MISGYTIEVWQGSGLVDAFAVTSFGCESQDLLRTVQGLVGGFIEAIPTADSITIFVNEDGKHTNLPENLLATEFWKSFDRYGCIQNGDYIAGNAVILGPTTKAGRTTSAPANTLDLIRALCGVPGEAS